LGVPARCFRLQKSASDAEVQRSVSPVGSGARGRGPGPSRVRKGSRRVKRRREPGSRWPSREAGELRSRALERALRGKGSCSMEGISDRSSSSHVHAIGLRAVSAASTDAQVARATWHTWERRQGCQRYGSHASRREENAHRGDNTTNVWPTEANRSDVTQAITPGVRRASAWHTGNLRGAGARTKNVSRQKSVRRIARRDARGAARQVGDTALVEELSAPSCWHTTRRLRDENGARNHAAHSNQKAFVESAAGATRSIRTRRKASRSSMLRAARRGVVAVLGHAGEHPARTARCASSQLPSGPGTGEAVPATATKDVGDRCCARWRLPQPTRCGRSVTRGAARRWPSKSYDEGFAGGCESNTGDRVGRGQVDRSWPVRTARPSCPISPNHANGRGPGNRTLTP